MKTFYFTRDLVEQLIFNTEKVIEGLKDKKDIPTPDHITFRFILDHPKLRERNMDKGILDISRTLVPMVFFDNNPQLNSEIAKEEVTRLKSWILITYGTLYAYLATPDWLIQAPPKFTREKQESHFNKVIRNHPDYITVGFTYSGRKRTYMQELCEVSGYWRKKSSSNPETRIYVRGYTKKFKHLKDLSK